MTELRIKMKGTRRGLSITLEEGDWQELMQEVDARLGQAPAFFRGSQVNLSTGPRDISEAELAQFIDLLARHDIQLVSLRTSSEVTAQTAQSLGVRLALPEASAPQTGARSATEDLSEGLLLRRTLRSGQLLQHPGHVVVIGDINPGAEIIAGGDVVVWGRVRGMVHAGALGDESAIVCALELSPTQLRIGSRIATSPDEKGRKGLHPEVAFVQDGQIVAEPWSRR